MKLNSTLAVTLIATAAGVAAWFLGIAKAVWPAHPQIAAFLITILATIVAKQFWPADPGRKRV